MNWLEQWKAISARIEGIKEAGMLLSLSLETHHANADSLIKEYIKPQIIDIFERLKEFSEINDISSKPLSSIKNLLEHKDIVSSIEKEKNSRLIVQSISALIVFRSEFEYLIKDSEIEGCIKTERAFEHLQRLIAVDNNIQENWCKAFKDGETKSESLGSVHLLSHGVWAFKINAEKARTDLVYNDSIDERESLIRRSSPTLVLTEWKIANQENYTKKIEEAKNQIKDYKSGVLNDIEIKQTRYIILVSKQQIKLSSLEDKEDDITYRYINIAVEPLTPSENAIKQSRKA